MKKNKCENLTFIIIMSIIIGSVLVWFPINHFLIHFGYKELQTTDNWVYFKYTKTGIIGRIDDFIESKKVSLQNRINNYFPFYQDLTSLFYKQIINSNQLLYKGNYPIGLNSDGEYVFYNDVDNFYYLLNNYNESELINRVNFQINFFNSLSESNKNVSLNIYYVPRFEQLDILDNNLFKYKKMFKDGLSKDINFSELEVVDTSDYLSKFYKTDHHWNTYGAYAGYKDIMNMLNKKVLELEIEKVSKKPYYGSMAKNSLSKLTNDTIYDFTYKPKYDVLVNGSKELDTFKPRQMTYSKGYEFYDYYVHYFNGQRGLVQYIYNDKNDNLLIFSDSYIWPIDYLIASEYKNTYVVNLRYDDYEKGKFNYNEFIKQNNITDVLFLYEGGATIFDQYNYKFSSKIVRN